MRCIFCRSASDTSRSVEHIIPESLGNSLHILPKGVVCDKCNNYFSREVEKPFMDTSAIRLLRFHQALASKKGRIPPTNGIIFPNIPVTLTRDLKTDETIVDVPPGASEKIENSKGGKLILPLSLPLEAGSIVSRFLAKIAVEAIASRLSAHPGGFDFVCNEVQFDLIRDHARKGKTPVWPVHMRRIYDANGKTFGPKETIEQVMHEFDFIVTPSNEWYFILALFGQEFTINLGGPSIEGYLRWLSENNNESPLYIGKNSNGYPLPISENGETYD